MYCDIFVCYVSMFHKLLYYFKRNQFVFSPELIFFVSVKVLVRFINHFDVKGFSSNLSSRTWVREKYIFSQLSQGKSYGFEVWSQGKSYRNLQKVRESFSKKKFPNPDFVYWYLKFYETNKVSCTIFSFQRLPNLRYDVISL